MAEIFFPTQNLLLRRLSPEDLERLGPPERVELGPRASLETADVPSRYVYFLESGVASVVSNGIGETEIGLIGREGMSDVGILYGDAQSPFETYMQIEGSGLRCETTRLQDALAHSETMNSLLISYARAFSIQIATTAAANGRSKLEERLARWLLMVSDRVGSTFHITHEFMSVMLAVRRAGVTLAIQSLEGSGLIRATRGEIRIVDREGLIEAANGVYGLAEREFARLLGS